MKKVHLLGLFLMFTMHLIADTVVVDYGFGIDQIQKMIVVNQDLKLLNSQAHDLITSIQIGDDSFNFIEKVKELKIGSAYRVKNEKGDEFALYFTRLPLIHITTTGKVNKQEKILADFRMVETNSETVSSPIGIKIRGGVSSYAFPKKNYRIEFWQDEDGNETKDVSLLGMRWDDDWNLQGMYNEPLRATNIVGFDLWRKMNTLYYQELEEEAVNGSRWQYGELFLDGNYQGVYGVAEPVDRKQLKLKKYKEDKGIRGELYKGMCTCSYGFITVPPENGNPIWDINFEYEYPNEIPANWDNLLAFSNFIVYSKDEEFKQQFPSYFNMKSAVDYFIFMNLLRANDNKGKNLYQARYDANEPYFFVAWDLDAVFGMDFDGTPVDITDDLMTNPMFNRLLKDDSSNGFPVKVKRKWQKLRKSWLNVETIVEMFREKHDFLLELGVYERDRKVWSEYAYDSQKSFEYLNSWLTRRLAYLDKEFAQLSTGIEDVQIDLNEPCTIQVYTVNGQLIKQLDQVVYDERGISAELNTGFYILNIENRHGSVAKKIIVP